MYLESLTAKEYYRLPEEPGFFVVLLLFCMEKLLFPGSA